MHAVFNLLKLERLISKMTMTIFCVCEIWKGKVKYISHSNVLQDHEHGFSRFSLIAIVINSAPTALCSLEVSPMCSKIHWLSCEMGHPHILPKCPCLWPLLHTKAGLCEPGSFLVMFLERSALHSITRSTAPFSTKTVSSKSCCLLSHRPRVTTALDGGAKVPQCASSLYEHKQPWTLDKIQRRALFINK